MDNTVSSWAFIAVVFVSMAMIALAARYRDQWDEARDERDQLKRALEAKESHNHA